MPLSHAVCCRPCLPESLPEDPTGVIPANDSAVAVVSIGCHASTAVGAAPPTHTPAIVTNVNAAAT